jgi:RecA-family ATPase
MSAPAQETPGAFYTRHTNVKESMNWFTIPQPETSWLVDGLIPSDGHAAICGKPKAGKSTFLRNLISSVIKGRDFLGRRIEVPAGTARVLYLHLDRKDQPWRVAKELRDLGITESEASRLTFRTAQDIPTEDFSDRLEWLKKEVIAAKPHLVVIDLMWQFVVAKNSNDYGAVLNGINALQDALLATKYQGALIVALHGRKATNPNDPADDMLGSTGQRGSFSTNVFLTRYRREGVYTILTEQTERDEHYGEIDETVIVRNQDGTVSLGRAFTQIAKEEKQVKEEAALRRLLDFIASNPGSEMSTIMSALNMSKKNALRLLAAAGELVHTTGNGVKGDPIKYFLIEDDAAQPAAKRFALHFGGLN